MTKTSLLHDLNFLNRSWVNTLDKYHIHLCIQETLRSTSPIYYDKHSGDNDSSECLAHVPITPRCVEVCPAWIRDLTRCQYKNLILSNSMVNPRSFRIQWIVIFSDATLHVYRWGTIKYLCRAMKVSGVTILIHLTVATSVELNVGQYVACHIQDYKYSWPQLHWLVTHQAGKHEYTLVKRVV